MRDISYFPWAWGVSDSSVLWDIAEEVADPLSSEQYQALLSLCLSALHLCHFGVSISVKLHSWFPFVYSVSFSSLTLRLWGKLHLWDILIPPPNHILQHFKDTGIRRFCPPLKAKQSLTAYVADFWNQGTSQGQLCPLYFS